MTDQDRILDLLTERTERALSDAEKQELDRLLAAHPAWRRLDLDFAAAASHLALDPALERMPDAVKARLLGALMGEAGSPSPASASSPPALRLAHDAGPAAPKKRPTPRMLYVGWTAAAAAAVLAVVGWWPRLQEPRVDVAAIAAAPDAIKVAWSTTDDPLGKAVAGEVVWSASQQTGFMRFRGLPANDKTKAQYQLWIFDAERDERYPVDGGVFDVGPDGESIVAITPRVPVGRVTLFAVTLERPGGVVVSTRERLVAVGKVG